MPHPSDELPPALARVLDGLARNRRPGWNFPGNFLHLSFEEVRPEMSRLTLEAGPHCVNSDGRVSLAAVAVLADIGLAATMRPEVGLATRMATVALSAQFTGVAAAGDLDIRSRLDGFHEGAEGRQGLARGEIRAGDALVCSVAGSFLALGNREGTAPLPMQARGPAPALAPLRADELDEAERAIYARAVSAHAAGAADSFLERFWGLRPEPLQPGARCVLPNGPHVGNRVGHTQGGITFALAAFTSVAALGAAWSLVALNASYVSPGKGARLVAESEVLHQGRLTAVVLTRIRDDDGRLVIEATSNHARRAGA